MSPPAIAAIVARRREGSLRGTFVTALRSADTVASVLVEVRTSDGARAWGEATPVRAVTGETIASVEETLGRLIPRVVGLDADDLDAGLDAVHVDTGDPSAHAALDLALHDLAARRRGISLRRLLGVDDTRTAVATDVTISAGDPAVMAEAARACSAEGFDVLKLKVGDGRADDVERVAAVAAAAPAARLRLDANQGWDVGGALALLDTLAARGVAIELLEQPVPADDLAALAAVTNRTEVPVLADEAVYTAGDVERVAAAGAADLVNLKLMKCGGLRPARLAADTAEAAGLGWLIGCMMERAPGVVAAASLAARSGPGPVHDLDAAWWQAPAELSYRDGHVHLPAGPGVGPTTLP